MKRNAYGQLIRHPYLCFADGDGGEGGGKTFTPPADQAALDQLINGATAKLHKRYEGHDDFKAKAEKWDAHEAAEAEKNKPKPKEGEAPAGLSQEDVDKRIEEARAADRLELALERVSDQLDKALEGRTFAASVLFNLDRKQFVSEDGKTVNADALKAWVEQNSTEAEAPDPKRKKIPGQGERGETTGLDSGKAAYEKRHPKKD